MFKGMLRGLFIVSAVVVLTSFRFIPISEDNILYVLALYSASVGAVDGFISNLVG